MLFSRKPKNRRLAREHVLDVKLRSSQVRARRTRLVGIAVGTLVATLGAAYLLWRGGELVLNRLVYTNNAFAIQTIDVQTDGVIAIDQLRQWMGVKLGENLLALDLGRIKRELELVPMVQSASIQRALPHTLRARIVERVPLAQANLPQPRPGGGIDMLVLQLDLDSFVFAPLDPRQRAGSAGPAPEALPVITGILATKLRPGHPVGTPQVRAALQLVSAFQHSPMAGLVDLKHIDASAPDVLLVSVSDGSEISFGLSDLDQQLRRWRQIFDLSQKSGKGIASVDLAVASNIPVRWTDSAPPTPIQPKPPRTPKTVRKTHV